MNKISLGSGDGEWCLCADDLDSESVIYSFGVGYDIGFELGLIRRLGCEVHAFDPDSREELAGLPAGRYLKAWLAIGDDEGLTTALPSTGVPVLTYLARDFSAGWRGKS